MDTHLALDLLRYTFFGIFGFGVALTAVLNGLSITMRRPDGGTGFPWWNVGVISGALVLLGVVALDRTFQIIEQDLQTAASWRTWALFAGLILFVWAQTLIFNIQRSHYADRRAKQALVELAAAEAVAA